MPGCGVPVNCAIRKTKPSQSSPCLPKPGQLIVPLDTPYDFAYTPDIARAAVTLLDAPDDAFGQAWDSIKPALAGTPAAVDPTVAPPGQHVMQMFVQYAPYKLAPELGTWDDQREAFGDAVIDAIAVHAPKIRDRILHRQVLTPLDIERVFGLTEGNIFQGELTLEQQLGFKPAEEPLVDEAVTTASASADVPTPRDGARSASLRTCWFPTRWATRSCSNRSAPSRRLVFAGSLVSSAKASKFIASPCRGRRRPSGTTARRRSAPPSPACSTARRRRSICIG